MDIFNSEDNIGSAVNKPSIERLYEVSREDTSKPLGSDFAERSMIEGEVEGITYGSVGFDFFINEAIPADIRFPLLNIFINGYTKKIKLVV